MRTTLEKEYLYWKQCKEAAISPDIRNRTVGNLKALQQSFLKQQLYDRANIIAGVLWIKTGGTMGL